jgi:hypothetical protein
LTRSFDSLYHDFRVMHEDLNLPDSSANDDAKSDAAPSRDDADAATRLLRSPFERALVEALARRGMRLEEVCPAGDAVAHRLLEEYGAMFVAADCVRVPPVCVFCSESEVAAFQREAAPEAAMFGADRVELQPAALKALLAARAEARAAGFDITPRGGEEAARRSYEDSVRLWRSRVLPALDHWCAAGRLTSRRAEGLCALPLRAQVEQVLALEARGLFFSKDFSKSILHSVAAPGASQHLSLLAFDVEEFRDPVVRRTLARHGWFQTVCSDLPHFTFLGLAESELPARGLKRIETGGQIFWIPDTDEAMKDESEAI